MDLIRYNAKYNVEILFNHSLILKWFICLENQHSNSSNAPDFSAFRWSKLILSVGGAFFLMPLSTFISFKSYIQTKIIQVLSSANNRDLFLFYSNGSCTNKQNQSFVSKSSIRCDPLCHHRLNYFQSTVLLQKTRWRIHNKFPYAFFFFFAGFIYLKDAELFVFG